MIAKQIARCGVPWERFGYLAEEPPCGGMLGDIESDDAPAIVGQYDHHVEAPKRRCDDDEHIDLRQFPRPDFVGSSAKSVTVSHFAGPCNLATVAWLTSMPSLRSSPWIRGSPPQRISPAHLTNQLTQSRFTAPDPTANANARRAGTLGGATGRWLPV
jgi:hypothetical protein